MESQNSNSGPGRNETYLSVLVLLVLLASLFVILFIFRVHLMAGGHGWSTADWLISSDVVHVRRGLFGSVLLRVSDALRISPLVTVIALQCCLAMIITVAAIQAVLRAPSRGLAALLVLSPGFCLLFWAANPDGTGRKELVTYTAMAMLLFTNGQPMRDRAIVVVAAGLFAFGLTGHIANAMMTPMFLYMASIALGQSGRAWMAAAGIMCVWAAFNTWYPIRFSGIDTAMDVCRPLLERGFDQEFCGSAISVTAARAARAVDFVAKQAYDKGQGLWLFLIYPSLLVPIVYLVRRTNGWNLLVWPMALSVLPLVPLYAVGVDWGRQTVMHVTPIILVALLMLLRGRIVQTRPIPGGVTWIFLLLAVLWAPGHLFGISWGMPIFVLLYIVDTF